jgi:alpha-glucosidase
MQGAQRYSSSWTGDNVATWEHLWIAYKSKGCQFLEWDLLALISVDSQNNLQVIYARWIQRCFHPFCRTHSSGDHGDQEPWAFDEDIIDITRKLTYGISCYHIYIPCFGRRRKKCT